MAYFSSLMLLIAYIYSILKHPYIKQTKVFFALFSLFTFRIILSLNHEISFKPLFAGQSLNSIFSIFSIFILFIFVKKEYFKFKLMIPFYLIIFSVLLSSVYSGEVMGGIVVAMKWLLVIVATIAVLQLLKRYKTIDTLIPFYNIFIAILISQFISLILHQGKDTENLVSSSNSISYIAGYAHEGAFSILLFMGLFLSSLLVHFKRIRPIIPTLFFIGLVIANYRTTLISAVLPFVVIYIAYFYLGAKKDFKVFVFSAGLLSVTLISFLFGHSILDRFAELGGAFTNLGELMRIDYSLFTIEERRLLSSRLYLWNMYLTEFSNFSFAGSVFGAGPEVWDDFFEVYSHNTFIGVLFDLGFLGLTLLLFLLFKTLMISLTIKELKLKIINVSFFIGFIILANSTMPLWAIEGLYFFAFIYAIFYHLSNITTNECLAV
ncbi:MAG: hypothetical protein V7726_02285 [Pseudoalteromonas distincta]|uniref:hypothetical protein n=1 Tax=Pseudoalteromonas distincta TaxID=77608 RepID=UPI0030025E1E